MADFYKGIDDLLRHFERESDTETAIKKGLALLETSKEFEANKFYLPNELMLDFAPGERGKAKLTVFRDNAILHVDEIALTKAKDRESFIDSLGLSDNGEIKAVNQCLMQLSMLKPQTVTKETASQEKFILSEILSDGRILEALSTKQIAVYSPDSDTVEYSPELVFDGVRYLPLNDDITNDGLLVDRVEDYSSESGLVGEIESYISRHYDLDLRELKIAAFYILLTYLVDVLFEVPYLHPQGASGSGKTRFGETIVSASYRPLIVFTATEASLFRMIDRYKPTVFIDEFNLQNSDDNQGIMQILNAGWSRLGKVRRCNDANEVESFSPFGCKIIASLQKMQSDALESRCVAIQTKETTRTDLRFANVGQIQADALKLRRKLLMFRFRNLSRDFLAETVEAENELKKYQIRPRVIQKATPLFMLITDTNLKKQFIEILQSETRITKELNKETFDFEVINAIHEILFNAIDENTVELRKEYQCELDTLTPKLFYDVQTVDGEVCEALTVENIVERINFGKMEKDKTRNDRFGRTISKRFNLETKKCWKRDEKLRKKTMVVFDSNKLATLFQNYSLPISANFTVATVANDSKPIETKVLTMATVNQKSTENNFTVATLNTKPINNLNGLATVATVDFEKLDGNSKNGNSRVIREI